LIPLKTWRRLAPFRQGYVFYMQVEWPTSELKGVQNVYAKNTPAWEEFCRGAYCAMLEAQDGYGEE
jgi:hypothetical protein